MTEAKRAERLKRNIARLNSCALHEFQWRDDVKRAVERKRRMEEETGVSLGVRVPIWCRCKNCGGKVSLQYAGGYMDAVKQMKKQSQQADEEERARRQAAVRKANQKEYISAEQFRSARREARLTLKEAADLAGITPAELNAYENEREPFPPEIYRGVITEFLNYRFDGEEGET